MNLLFTRPEWMPEWFASWGWIAVLAAVVVLVVCIVIICVRKSAKNSKTQSAEIKADGGATAQDKEEQVQEPAEEAEPDEPAEESEPAEPAEDTEVSAEEEKKAEEQEEKAAAETPVKAKPSTKTYHISKRKADNKWQVKMAGGSRAIKLFNTQAEAIDFAKKLAESQEARIVIHKEDGSFRRLTYHNKK